MTGRTWGLLAEFESPERLVEAAASAKALGLRKIEAYTPFPVEGLREALGIRTTRLPWAVLLGGVFGAAFGFGLQYWVSVVEYPMNVGGKPDNSWPAFIPITFETTVLFAAIAAVLGMLAANGLPRPHHPLFDVRAFRFASRDRFFLAVSAEDPKFDAAGTRTALEKLRPVSVEEVAS
jgi:Protein of unknown function (DUF3341)